MDEHLTLDLKLLDGAVSVLKMFAVLKKIIIFFIMAFLLLEGIRTARNMKALKQ
ncbi:MAG: hypothetical protein GX051_04685 [Clostridiales bacterium]|nr:hypothetical protein [Clostridiales bacterium]